MNQKIKKVIASNSVIIVCAILIGYSLWRMLARNQIVQQRVEVPVTIYRPNGEVLTQASINAVVQGARHRISALGQQPLRANVTVAEGPVGKVEIKSEHVLLPEEVTLVSYEPKNIMV